MFLFGAAALLLASDTSRTMIESVFAELTVFFATNTRLCITAFVVVASLMALRWLRGASKILNNTNTLITRDAVSSEYSFYEEQFKDPKAVGKRQENYKNMVNFFYDLVTDFYEWGWGKSFHFAPRFKVRTRPPAGAIRPAARHAPPRAILARHSSPLCARTHVLPTCACSCRASPSASPSCVRSTSWAAACT